MASNTTLNSGTGGDVIATKERTHDGDASKVQVVSLAGVSGTEGSYTFGDIGGDATNGLDVDVTRVIPGTSATHLGKAIDAVAGATDTGVVLLGVRDDALTTLTPADGDYVPIRTDSTGSVHVRVSAGSISGFVNDAALTIGTSEGIPVMGRASTAVPTAVGADNDAVHAWMTRNGATVISGDVVDDAAFTPGTSRVVVIGAQADETATDSVDEGDGGALRMTLDRKLIVTPYVHAAAGGHTPFKSLDLDESEEEVKGSGGKLFWIHCMNLHASATRYLKIYNNTAGGTTVGTTVPDLTFPIPATVNGFAIHFGDAGLALGTGITVAATTGFADNDSGAPGANEVVFNCGYI